MVFGKLSPGLRFQKPKPSEAQPNPGPAHHYLQDQNGGVLAHIIKDLSQTHLAKSIGAAAYTTDRQVFHTDTGDIVSLFALETAAEGGVSKISSSWQVYNDLAENRPDLINTLSQPWPFDA